MEVYQQQAKKHQEDFLELKKKYDWMSFFRLLLALLFLICVYLFIFKLNKWAMGAGVLFAIPFIILMRWQPKVKFEMDMKQALVQINEQEYSFLLGEPNLFEAGLAYQDFSHPYSFDLDVFGEKSLYQHLNRTGTFMGSKQLALLLLNKLNNNQIEENQFAIKELSNKIAWRYDLLALTKISKDSAQVYQKLINWSKTASLKLAIVLRFLSYATPVLLGFLILTYIFFDNIVQMSWINELFAFNILIILFQVKTIKKEILETGRIAAIIQQYGRILQKIETESFESPLLSKIQSQLVQNSQTSSKKIQQLSKLFADLESSQNLVGAALLNGLFLYHIHTLFSLQKWKNEHAEQIETWLKYIGQIEALNSLANFSYNNPTYVFPNLNNSFEISFKDLGHPLINNKGRVTNDIDFKQSNFFIITGSNMSGKSTFLRTLGVNMILSGIGSVVCAQRANIHPLEVLVSMRLSDSLAENESYFFAEVKRLKLIMDKLEKGTCFVILDEILKGTNSNDKQSGTIGVIKKLISKNAMGLIATHDLEICELTEQYPAILANKCFEVDLANDELKFDYKLLSGICKNKSATFLMNKLGII